MIYGLCIHTWWFYAAATRLWWWFLGYNSVWSFTDHYYWPCSGILDIYFDHAETHMVYEYTSWMDLDLLSPMRQFVFSSGHLQWWLSLSRLSQCSFGLSEALSEQMWFLTSWPRALCLEGVVQPLVFTILPPSRTHWCPHLDNAGTPRGSLGQFHASRGISGLVEMAIEEIDLGYWGNVIAWDDQWW